MSQPTTQRARLFHGGLQVEPVPGLTHSHQTSLLRVEEGEEETKKTSRNGVEQEPWWLHDVGAGFRGRSVNPAIGLGRIVRNELDGDG